MDFDLAEFDLSTGVGDGGHGHEDVDQFADDIGIFGLDAKEVEDLRSLKDAVLFIIDCRPSMVLAPNPHNKDNKSSVETALHAVECFMKSKIVSNDNDRIGVLLYNTERSENQLNFSSIHLLQNLELIDAQRILQIQELQTPKKLESSIKPAKKEVPLFEVFWIANTELKALEKLAFAKRIFLFTDESRPNQKNQGDQQRALQRAQDLAQLGVNIELFPMPKPADKEPHFDVRPFYSNVIFVDPDDHAQLAQFAQTQDRISELMDRIRHKQFQKRIGGRCQFALQPNMSIGVQFYQMIRPANVPSSTQMDGRTNKPLKSTTTYTCEETGTQLYQNQIGHCIDYGGEKVPITREDMKKIKNFDTPGLKLMGFKPQSKLKDYHNIRPSYFLYPDQKHVEGSSEVFDALIKTMKTNNTMAIARFQPKSISMVRFCALLPQPEQIDEEDGFQTPPGFQLIFLPYANDIRAPEGLIAGEKPEVSEEDVDIAKGIVEQLTIDFNPRGFENPKIQNFYTSLQSFALKEDEPQPIEDLLQPNEARMKQIEHAFAQLLGDFADDIMEAEEVPKTGAKKGAAKKAPPKKKAAPKPRVGKGKHAIHMEGEGDQGEEEFKLQPPKRKAAQKEKRVPAASKSRKKKEEIEDEVLDDHNGGYDLEEDDDDLRDQMKKGELDELTAAELKELAKERKIETRGKKKADVLAALKKYLKVKK